MTTTSSDKVDLDAAFRAAAEAADPTKNDFGPDGGTCNFDTATISPKRGQQIGPYQKAAAKYGFRVESFQWMGGRAWWVFPAKSAGQGCPQTKQAEVIAKVLEEHGIKTNVYYQMD